MIDINLGPGLALGFIPMISGAYKNLKLFFS